MPFFLTVRIDAGSCTSPSNIRQLVGILPSSISILIGIGSIALVWLCPNMVPRGTIRLDETIQALDSALCPVSVWYGSQYIIHLSNSGQAPNNEGTFWSVESVVNELNLFLPQVFDSADRLPLNVGLISVNSHLQLRFRVSNLRNPERFGSNWHYQWVGPVSFMIWSDRPQRQLLLHLIHSPS